MKEVLNNPVYKVHRLSLFYRVSLIQPGAVSTPINETMVSSGLGGLGSKSISDNPDVHEIDRKLSMYRDHDLEWSKCPSITAEDVRT